MPLVPTSAIPVIRSALVGQGFPMSTISDDGSIDPVALLSGAYSTITFTSQLTPAVKIDVASLNDGKPSWFPALVKPAVVFSGRAGRAVIAPYGFPGENIGTAVAVGLVVVLVGAGYLMGKNARRR